MTKSQNRRQIYRAEHSCSHGIRNMRLSSELDQVYCRACHPEIAREAESIRADRRAKGTK